MSDRLDEIKARLAAATPGPWTLLESDHEWEIYNRVTLTIDAEGTPFIGDGFRCTRCNTIKWYSDGRWAAEGVTPYTITNLRVKDAE